MLFVPGQGEDGAAAFVGIIPGAAGAVALSSDVLHAGRLTIGPALNHTSPEQIRHVRRGVKIPKGHHRRPGGFQWAHFPARKAVIVDSR